MNPVIVTRDNKPVLVCGTPGADTQVQTNLQLITHILDFGMTPQEAVEAPRWRSLQNPMESTVPHTCEDVLQLEGRFSADVREGLAHRGHDLRILGDWDGPRQRPGDPHSPRNQHAHRRVGPASGRLCRGLVNGRRA